MANLDMWIKIAFIDLGIDEVIADILIIVACVILGILGIGLVVKGFHSDESKRRGLLVLGVFIILFGIVVFMSR